MPPLVDVNWLGAHFGDPNIILLEVRFYLKASPRGKTAREEYENAHLPGAHFVDLERDATAPEGPGRHPIPSRAQIEGLFSKVGATRSTRFVVYDDAGGSIASRLYFLFRHYGHDEIAVLDGGLAAWEASGRPLTREIPKAEPTFVTLDAPRLSVTDKAGVKAALGRGALVLDARAEERYLGTTEPIDARAGHVPGAKNLPFSRQLENGVMRSPSDLRALYTELGDREGREVIVYCGSGVTACHLLLGRAVAGLDPATLYEGSWGDWARDSSLPLATAHE